jgi:hypothetical protein
MYINMKLNPTLTLPHVNETTSRKEILLRNLCEVNDISPKPISSRIETFIKAILDGEFSGIEPISRSERYFYAIFSGDLSKLPSKPQSRSEVLLEKIALGNEDLTDIEPIQSRYELYLAYIIQNGILTGDNEDDYLLTESGLYLLNQLNEKIKLELEETFHLINKSGDSLVTKNSDNLVYKGVV